jgi:hypothetical protein
MNKYFRLFWETVSTNGKLDDGLLALVMNIKTPSR